MLLFQHPVAVTNCSFIARDLDKGLNTVIGYELLSGMFISDFNSLLKFLFDIVSKKANNSSVIKIYLKVKEYVHNV